MGEARIGDVWCTVHTDSNGEEVNLSFSVMSSECLKDTTLLPLGLEETVTVRYLRGMS